MSFSAEGFGRKLNALQETQDLIVSLSQWVLFHHRHLSEIAQMWADAVTKLPPGLSRKQLTLLYLCNDVVQAARRKRKQEFMDEFGKVVPKVLLSIYARLDSATQAKVDRMINVWKDRLVYLDLDIAKFKQATKLLVLAAPSAAAGPGPSKSSGVAPELKHLNDLFTHLNSISATSQGNLTQFGVQLKHYLPDGELDNLPLPKVYLSKLNTLEKLGEMAKGNICEQQLIKSQIKRQLSTILSTLDEGMGKDEDKLEIIATKMAKLQETRKELQEMIDEQPEAQSPAPVVAPVVTSAAPEDDDEDGLPTYEIDLDDEDAPNKATALATPEHELIAKLPAFSVEGEENGSSSRKRRLSQTPLGGLTPAHKKVAFSEDIEVKEFDKDEGHELDDGEGDGQDVMSLLMKLS